MTNLAEVPREAHVDALRVLIVDDDVAIQTLMRTLLIRRGVAVDCAGDGEDALRSLDIHDYDAIVLDLMLPRMNGFDVIEALQKRSPELLERVIVVTAVSEHTLRAFDRRSVRLLLRKPFDIDVFIREVFACGQHERQRARSM